MAGFNRNWTLGKCIGNLTIAGMYHTHACVSMTIDNDECITNEHNCSDRTDRRNTIGGYECMCKKGYNSSMGFEEECQGEPYNIMLKDA